MTGVKAPTFGQFGGLSGQELIHLADKAVQEGRNEHAKKLIWLVFNLFDKECKRDLGKSEIPDIFNDSES